MDPEMPLLTLDDLGVLRDVEVRGDGSVLVTITPTYSGCPAMATMRDDIEHKLRDNGYSEVEIVTSLTPAWSTDWISDEGRRKLRETGYSVPGPAPKRTAGPVPLTLTVKPREIACPQCSSMNTILTSEFGATLCKAQYRCNDCREPFDHVKEI
ncbi:1,2-phenylacetyl-CoA epoxidase subunit PaaD [Rhodococcoides fascians]|uniref:1,2-phenylacetyl-CoA epoxidase subunit PaaD n=1 Tax=Rhodococcoides fascians TaxID=1828 RepID=UPI00068DAE8A|nr:MULTISPECIES: 1,2-phenylacetyl-CoA epoxidase subunit PaaD [Rhodococcus]OZF01356.1 phenylacetate-CoA oxygenase subunit PaaJ [Rhodococcus sp. 15-1189-1-1a]OZF15526.1 phenylacetate-CoA oxygenase subunit PaaJ [Rhodococcus sp. 14-2686-1-2]